MQLNKVLEVACTKLSERKGLVLVVLFFMKFYKARDLKISVDI